MFIQTANALALIRKGEEVGRPQKAGTIAAGSVRFSGVGGMFIPTGTIVSVDRPTLGDTLDFVTTEDGTIPDPGIPTAPTATDNGAGTLTGTFEYGVTFQTIDGETELGAISVPLVLAAHKTALTASPIGGPGTTERRIYRRVNGGPWGWLHDLADNVTTVYNDNGAVGAGVPPSVSTAERVTVTAQSAQVGAVYNVAVGTITDISDAPANLDDVTNLVTFTGGTDQEDIEAFRQALLKWVRAPQTGSPSDLEVWAETVDGVESATCFNNVNLAGAATPGTAVVRISGPGGSIPDSAVEAAVLAVLEAHDLTNITILVGVNVAHVIDVAITVTLKAGFVLADVSQSVISAISQYILSVPVGGHVYVAGLEAAAFGLPGVATVQVTTPAADVALAATEKATVGTITPS
jgi:uncharacterized phage protein gp47/JayE